MWKEGTLRRHPTVISETTSTSVLFSIFIRQRTAFVIGMRKMTQARVLFFFLVLLNSPKNQITFHSFQLFCFCYESNTYILGSCIVLSCATLSVPVSGTGWKEKKHRKVVTLSLFPVKWTVWVEWWYKDFYCCSKTWDQFESKKLRFAYQISQISDVKIDNASHGFYLNRYLVKLQNMWV